MQHLFLTSSIGTPGVSSSIRHRLGHNRTLKTAFITTPIEPPDQQNDLTWYETDRAALRFADFDLFDYSVTDKQPSDFSQDLSEVDAIYVSGGDARHLLKQSHLSGFIPFIREYVKSGKLYISTSAGSIITGPTLPPYLWGEENDCPDLNDFSAYHFVDFTLIPHWGSSWFKELYLGGRIDQIYSEALQPFILCNDHQYIEVTGDQYKIIDTRHE